MSSSEIFSLAENTIKCKTPYTIIKFIGHKKCEPEKYSVLKMPVSMELN